MLDLGCGRGEFLDLLRERDVRARGVDVNAEMVEECRARGLDARAGDALALLDALEDESLGGLFAAQVVEHLQPDYLVRLLNVAGRKLRPGARIVLETINPRCWFAFFDAYIRDITHVRPLHPDTLTYLLGASGFQRTTVRYLVPYPDDGKLQRIPPPDTLGTAGADRSLAAVVETFNGNVDKLNDLLFTHLDYAAIGERIQPGVYPTRRRIPTVNVAVAMTVSTIQRMSLVSKCAISARTPAISVRCSVRSSAICVEKRVSRAAISVRNSARPALNWSEVTWSPYSTPWWMAWAMTSAWSRATPPAASCWATASVSNMESA